MRLGTVWLRDGEQGRCGLGPWVLCPVMAVRQARGARSPGRQAGSGCGQNPNPRSIF